MIEYVLYATRIGAEDWQEEMLGCDTKNVTEAQLAEMRQILQTKGYDRVRVAVIDLSVPPDFVGSIRKG